MTSPNIRKTFLSETSVNASFVFLNCVSIVLFFGTRADTNKQMNTLYIVHSRLVIFTSLQELLGKIPR